MSEDEVKARREALRFALAAMSGQPGGWDHMTVIIQMLGEMGPEQ